MYLFHVLSKPFFLSLCNKNSFMLLQILDQDFFLQAEASFLSLLLVGLDIDELQSKTVVLLNVLIEELVLLKLK